MRPVTLSVGVRNRWCLMDSLWLKKVLCVKEGGLIQARCKLLWSPGLTEIVLCQQNVVKYALLSLIRLHMWPLTLIFDHFTMYVIKINYFEDHDIKL